MQNPSADLEIGAMVIKGVGLIKISVKEGDNICSAIMGLDDAKDTAGGLLEAIQHIQEAEK
jgi:hypothetical protein